jgi:hypothetical protein
MDTNDILKASKRPLDYGEAFKLHAEIELQKHAEMEYKKYHAVAQDLRIKIQLSLGFGMEEYYQFVNSHL